jgi:serine/threonine protein kinase
MARKAGTPSQSEPLVAEHDALGLKLGDTLDERYVLLEELGRGATSVVFAATDSTMGGSVAIKVMAPHAPSGMAVERFMREVSLAKAIEHPGVVRIHDAGSFAGAPYVVMERLAGQDLARFVRSRPNLSLEEVLGIARELLDALHALHQAGVIHRDLKPANVFVETCGSSGERCIKILDFGLARRDDAESDLTASGQILGSLPYMAPELLEGAANASAASDIYAVVCVVYELAFGHLPFSGDSRAALRLAIRNDPVRVPCRHEPALHQALTALFQRGLAKDPARRFFDAEALAEALAVLPASQHGGEHADQGPAPANIPERFRVRRLLAEGAHGEVYAVYDRDSGRELALKRLRRVTPENLSRFKREFRALARVRHANLARLEELWVEGEVAFFTMELIVGERLSDAMERMRGRAAELGAQIAAGLAALHARDLVHRDLKPSNVVLEDGGRAVIVDFGSTVVRGASARAEGTERFVAPELLNGEISPAADMYALGMLLREVLGDETLSARSDELARLCRELVATDPALRPSAREVVERLSPSALPGRTRGPTAAQTLVPFVGRSEELATLERALKRAASGPVIVEVHGPSGIGKTALVERFGRSVARFPGALVLESSCHRSETLPLPALDSAIEALALVLRTWPSEALARIAPRRIRALCKLLPALAQVPWPAWGEQREVLPHDPKEQRGRAVEALRELLQRLSNGQSVTIVVDDAQWIDGESLSLLRTVLGGSEPPELLLVLVFRDGEGGRRRELFEGLAVERVQLPISALCERDGRELARELWRGNVEPSASRLDDIVRTGGGNPYFMSLLAQHAAESELPSTTLSAALLGRFLALGEGARRVLEILSLCYRPLAARTVLRTASVTNDVLHELESGRWIRVFPRSESDAIEPYHAIVAETIAQALPVQVRARHHRALADALRVEASADQAALVAHTAASGDFGAAARIAEQAATAADRKLAFESAAALYRVALSHEQTSPSSRVELQRRLAAALANAGRARDAAETLLEASRLAPLRESVSLRRRAGELFLQSGDLEHGLAVVAEALSEVGLSLPADVPSGLEQGLRAFQELLTRGLSYTERAEAACDPRALERIDLCLSLAQSLNYVDLRFLGFLLQGLLFALQEGEPVRLQRALALFVAGTASHLSSPLTRAGLEKCRALTELLGGAEATVLLGIADAEVALFDGDFLRAEVFCEKTERLILESCVGAWRELADVRSRSLLIQYSQKGDYKSIFPRSVVWQQEADERKDRFHANWLRAAHALVWVARDRPDVARAELERAEADWPGGAGVFEVAVALYHDVIDRYLGDDTAHLHPAQGRASVLDSPASQTPFLEGYLWLTRAWGALRALNRTGRERALAEESIRRLRALDLGLWLASADAFESNLLFLDGRRESGIERLEQSERTFRRINVLSLAACARKRRGQFMAGALGRRLEAEADGQLVDLGVVAPEKFVGAYFAPFPVGAATLEDSTLIGDAREEPAPAKRG